MNVSRNQKGAALVVSLVILAIVTLIGVAGMQSTQLEMKMASSARDRSDAFSAVEATLVLVESELIEDPPHDSQFFSAAAFSSGSDDDFDCTSSDCYNATCNKGLCFRGVITEDSCSVNSALHGTNFWVDSDLDIWNNSESYSSLYIGPNGLVGTASSDTIEVKYIIEFMCHTGILDKPLNWDASGDSSDDGASARMKLFRVTARAKGLGGRAEVTLQSMVRIAG